MLPRGRGQHTLHTQRARASGRSLGVLTDREGQERDSGHGQDGERRLDVRERRAPDESSARAMVTKWRTGF
jgi:hypothetical protein